MSDINQMDLINAEIEYGEKGTTNKEITENILSEWRGSQKIKDMQSAENYFLVQNEAIEKKSRDFIDRNTGAIVVNDTLANTKTKTSKYRQQILRKTNFALNKPFIISCDDNNYRKAWEDWLDEDIRDTIEIVGKQAINKGISWCFPYINEEGILKLIKVDSQTIYPAWADTEHKILDAIVRDYVIIEYINKTPNLIYKVEFWDNKVFQRFKDYSQGQGNGDLVDDTFSEDSELSDRASLIQTHMTNRQGEGISWDKVPFIAFKGNDDELPSLNECKTDVDGYDMLKSKSMDSLLDDIDAVLCVENISPEWSDLVQARKMVQESRIISYEQGGSAHFEKVNADITAVKEQLDMIKKDMINDTNDIDMTTVEFGSNPSSKAMRMFFENLNIWANGFEKQFRLYMKNLKYFFDKWLSWKGGFGTFEELQKKKITFTLDRDLMVDETDIIDNIVKLQDELSQETKDELNPYIEDPEKEAKRREEDEKKALEKQELYQFEQVVNNENNPQTVNNSVNNLEEETGE